VEKFCSGDVLLQETFCYGDVTETFCMEMFCRGDVLCGNVLYVRQNYTHLTNYIPTSTYKITNLAKGWQQC
jgi:hypothetical protein